MTALVQIPTKDEDGMSVGQVLIAADVLLAVRDALIDSDYDEAYHILRIAADPGNAVFREHGDHWAQWEAIRDAAQPLPAPPEDAEK